MNSSTRRDLVNFIESVQELAQGCIHMAGVDIELLGRAEILKEALEHDETIIEPT